MAPTMLSVRGEARRTVSPDYAVCHFGLHAVDGSTAAALGRVAELQATAVASLGALGAVVHSAESHLAPLTWSVGSVSTWEDFDHDKTRSRRRRADAPLIVTCRDLDRLSEVVEALAVVDGVSFGGVTWLVDDDNAGWRLVRADAIAAALAKGSDYATALGGTVRSVEHVADQGLLSDGDHAGPHDVVSLAARASAGGGDQPVPRLDPEPQELRTLIEARLVAEVPELGAGD